MTSRRGTLVEEGARELLQMHGYTVRVIPPGFNKKFPPAHLVATLPIGRDTVHPHPEIVAPALHGRYGHAEMRP